MRPLAPPVPDVTMVGKRTFLVSAVAWLASFAGVAALAQPGTLVVDGTIESSSGGFELPDASQQSRAFGAEANVVVVAKSGGDFTSIQAALDSINASASDRYLVKVGPGTYNEQVTMEPYVDIEGAGMDATKVTWSGSLIEAQGTVLCAQPAELRSLTVENTGGAFNFATAVACDGSGATLRRVRAQASGGLLGSTGVFVDSASPSLIDVEASASGTLANGLRSLFQASPILRRAKVTAEGDGTSFGVDVNQAEVTLIDVEVTARGGSVSNVGINGNWGTAYVTRSVITADGGNIAYGFSASETGEATIRHSTLIASGGLLNNFGIRHASVSGSPTTTVEHSRVSGATATIRSETGLTVLVATSQLEGGAVDDSAGGTVTCAAVWDESYAFSPGTCP